MKEEYLAVAGLGLAVIILLPLIFIYVSKTVKKAIKEAEEAAQEEYKE